MAGVADGTKSDKKKKRLKSKLRKAQAYLSLVKEGSDAPQPNSNVSSDNPEVKSEKKKEFSTASAEEALSNFRKRKREMEQKILDKQGNDVDQPPSKMVRQPMSEEVLAEFRRIKRQKIKESMGRPKLLTTLDELTRGFPVKTYAAAKQTPPLYMMDLQHLLLNGLLGNMCSIKPRWCRLLRVGKVTKVALVVLDSVCAQDVADNDCLPSLNTDFDINVDMIPSAHYGSTVQEDLITVPLSISQIWKQEEQSHSIQAVKDNLPLPHVLSTVVNDFKHDKFDRTLLLLTPAQMIIDGYPTPIPSEKYDRYVFTSDKYAPVTEKSPLFAMDCEMCLTTTGINELTRVSLVNENLECIYDTFVKPYNRIVDYLTKYSGVTKKILDPVTTRLEDVQKKLRKLIPVDAILCGQSLGGDLRATETFHPYVIDTGLIYNLSGNRRIKAGLKRLTYHFLGKTIQDSLDGHSSVEDASATMQLVLLKLRNGLLFGDTSVGGDIYTCRDTVVALNPGTNDTNSDPDFSAVRKRKLFFQSVGKRFTTDFMCVLQEQKKSGQIVDDMGSPPLYPDNTPVYESGSDRESREVAKNSILENNFTMVHLYGYRELLQKRAHRQEEDDVDCEKDEASKQKCLQKLDKHVRKVMQHLPPCSLFVVVLTGGEGDTTAKTFAKIT